ncbi:hypothetical protein NLX83_18185 [Allokutzneria sp. A3M-2-11 16]|uniref:hypothetical protein n=1 Tax=Allokutzneria sp. A3M-2-11 16 TaxID=2962043 RepID=UPI0020B7851B|nr:hypothetical protein [Allokutzneria sp. A3M-2-11 16]MCP3801192.1 hypothetical protein [Allokutzneria sp. A3M-2-11 16]
MTPFWEATSGRLRDRVAHAGAPAVIFWLGGLALVPGGPAWLATVPGAFLFAGALVGSAVLVNQVAPLALQVLQGPWPGPLKELSRKRTAELSARVEADELKWHELTAAVKSDLATDEERAEYVELARRLSRCSADVAQHQPTRVGNLLSAAQARVGEKYGLDAVITWPRLWLVLPKAAREELAAARAALHSSAATLVWAALFCGFTWWSWWALPIGLALIGVTAWFWVPSRAANFAALFESTYDLHRAALYEQLRWPMPQSSVDEREQGRALTKYLLRGTRPSFT